MSTAAQLALGGDKIYMGPGSQLGPLDMQLDYENRQDYVSGVDVADSLALLDEEALEYLTTILQALSENLDYSPQDVFGFASQLFGHSLTKVDPILMARVRRNLTSPIRYITQALELRRCQAPDDFDAAQVASNFVFGRTSHEDVIDRIEATRLGLPIRDIRQYPYFPTAHNYNRIGLVDWSLDRPLARP